MSDTDTRNRVDLLPPHYEPDDRWVPVDRRWLGLDRATLIPAAVVIAFALVMAFVLPTINDSVSYDDEVVAGDVMELDGGITFVPVPDWGITAGVRDTDTPITGTYPDAARVTNGAVSFTVKTAPFTGDARELLEQIKTTTDALATGESFRVNGEPTVIITESGHRGVMAGYSNSTADGVIAAFVIDGVGVSAIAVGPSNIDPSTTEAIARMIVSISQRPGEGS